MLKFVVDMMGGDNGAPATTQGVLDFLKKHDDVELVCVGRIEELKDLENNPRIKLVDARDIVPMEAGAMDALRLRNSSMYIASETFLSEKCDAIISSGSTGAFLTTTSVKLKKIPGVLRPALISPFPTKIKDKKVTILDIGASNENSPEELVQFAFMGSLYAKCVFGIQEPSVYLLSNGTEEGKGSPVSKEAYKLLKDTPNFKGNIEAREALNGDADVIVSEGFTGNVFLKSSEGMAKMMSGFIKGAFKRNFFSKIGYLFSKKGFDNISETMDYKSTGGALLIGVNGVVVKAHGSSDAYTFMSALNVAYKLCQNDIINKLKGGFENA